MGLPSRVPDNFPNTTKKRKEIPMITPNAAQYVLASYASSSPLTCTEKYAVIRLTGIKRMVTLAKRIVIRVRRSTAWDSLSVMRLKFFSLHQQEAPLISRLEERTKNTKDSFSSRQSCISLRAKRLILSLNLSKRTVAAEERDTL